MELPYIIFLGPSMKKDFAKDLPVGKPAKRKILKGLPYTFNEIYYCIKLRIRFTWPENLDLKRDYKKIFKLDKEKSTLIMEYLVNSGEDLSFMTFNEIIMIFGLKLKTINWNLSIFLSTRNVEYFKICFKKDTPDETTKFLVDKLSKEDLTWMLEYTQ